MWTPAMSSALFTVSIDTSLGLVWLQIASSIRCAANSSSTDRAGRNVGSTISETWAPILNPLLGAVESWGIVTSPTCAPAVPVVVVSLSSDLESSPFFEFLFPLFCVNYLGPCYYTLSTDILPLLQRLPDKLICFLMNTKGVDPSWRYRSWNSFKEA